MLQSPVFDTAEAPVESMGIYVLTEPIDGLTEPIFELKYKINLEVAPAEFRTYAVGEKKKAKM